MSLAVFAVSAAAFLVLVLPRVESAARLITALGAVPGAVFLAFGSDPLDHKFIGFSLMLVAAILSTRGRPYLLYEGSLRLPPVEESDRVLNRRRWLFVTVMTVLLIPFAMIATA